jgi:chromate transporter
MISSALGGIAGQILVIVLGGVIGYFFLKSKNLLPHNLTNFHLTKRIGSLFLFTFLLLLFLLPILNSIYTLDALDLFDRFFRIGSLVFGGGHVVLSLLEVEVVGSGIISSENFISGYGFAQGIPGPLFTISAFIGAVSNHSITGFWGAIIALLSVFLPSYLLVLGILPFWEGLRKLDAMASIMGGVNASVVGLLLATFYNPLFVQTIRDSSDFYLLGVSVILLQFWKFPSIVIVVCLALVGLIL